MLDAQSSLKTPAVSQSVSLGGVQVRARILNYFLEIEKEREGRKRRNRERVGFIIIVAAPSIG